MGLEVKIMIKTKHNIIMFINYYEKDGEKYLKIDEKIVQCNKKQLLASLEETPLPIEYVYERPEKFKFGVLYVMTTPGGRPTYIYTHQIN